MLSLFWYQDCLHGEILHSFWVCHFWAGGSESPLGLTRTAAFDLQQFPADEKKNLKSSQFDWLFTVSWTDREKTMKARGVVGTAVQYWIQYDCVSVHRCQLNDNRKYQEKNYGSVSLIGERQACHHIMTYSKHTHECAVRIIISAATNSYLTMNALSER